MTALGVAAVFIIVFALVLRPSKLVPDNNTDRWAAEAALMGFGGLFLAFVGTSVAVVAYINSTDKPALHLAQIHDYDMGPFSSQVGHGRLWQMTLLLQNEGSIAARFAAVRLTFSRQVWSPEQAGFGHIPQYSFTPWSARSTSHGDSLAFWWEGGADAVIHPGWEYMVPQVTLAVPDSENPANIGITAPDLEVTIEVVADVMTAFKRQHVIHFVSSP